MFSAQTDSTGTSYTGTVAWLVLAFVFIPAVWIVSRPLGSASLTVAILCSAICTALAVWNWSRFSQLAIPSLTSGLRRKK